ncbi:MAG: transposase [Pseudomonadota bacterium]
MRAGGPQKRRTRRSGRAGRWCLKRLDCLSRPGPRPGASGGPSPLVPAAQPRACAEATQSRARSGAGPSVRVQAHDRKRLEQLCRYITRPALSDERVQLNAAGQVELRLNTPWRDGTTHLVLRRDANSPVDCLRQPKGPSFARARPARLSPLEFMQRLAAPVPRPSFRRAIQPDSSQS